VNGKPKISRHKKIDGVTHFRTYFADGEKEWSTFKELVDNDGTMNDSFAEYLKLKNLRLVNLTKEEKSVKRRVSMNKS